MEIMDVKEELLIKLFNLSKLMVSQLKNHIHIRQLRDTAIVIHQYSKILDIQM